jgi:small subunit ribosomal protein S2
VRLGGLKEMRRLPKAIFIIDTRHEENAIAEATTLGIPLVAMCDTNSDPDPIAYPIPSNDDAIRAIKLICGKIADAAIEGKNIRGVIAAEVEEDTGIAAPEAVTEEPEEMEAPEESNAIVEEIEPEEAGEGEAV